MVFCIKSITPGAIAMGVVLVSQFGCPMQSHPLL
jgi:hypothetical protein